MKKRLPRFLNVLDSLTKRSTAPAMADFALIPAGTFTMGDALDGDILAQPPHLVQVSAFYLQTTPVSKGQWDDVRAWGLLHGYTDLAAGAGKAENHPAQKLSWYDAVKWCNAKSEMEGLSPCYYTDAAQTALYQTNNTDIDKTMVKWQANGYRLPTEAEWEKAAAGGAGGKRFPWGDTITHSHANYTSSSSDSYDVSQTRDYHPDHKTGAIPYTSPVGGFDANGYGIFDMAGNVWEWCWDWYWRYSSTLETDPRGGDSGSDRVLRGGGWYSYANCCRTAYRGSVNPADTNFGIGFRLVRSTVA